MVKQRESNKATILRHTELPQMEITTNKFGETASFKWKELIS